MKFLTVVFAFGFFVNVCSAQGIHSFNKYFNQSGVGDWIKFGQLNAVPSGAYVNVKTWAHYASQLFYLEFDVAAVYYGNPNLDWVEVAPRLSSGFDGLQNFALDVKYKCVGGCALEMRLRRKSGGGGPGSIYFIVETNESFSDTDVQGTSGVVEPGYLGNNGGWKFPVSINNFSNTQEGIFLNGNGNVGIGMTMPAEKLSVNGKIRAKEIKIELTNWPDYVFLPSYKVPTLQETEKHIKEKGHLPGIPSAKEVEANGVELGEMNKKLLQKIEELTLHLIRQEKEINALREQVKK